MSTTPGNLQLSYPISCSILQPSALHLNSGGFITNGPPLQVWITAHLAICLHIESAPHVFVVVCSITELPTHISSLTNEPWQPHLFTSTLQSQGGLKIQFSQFGWATSAGQPACANSPKATNPP